MSREETGLSKHHYHLAVAAGYAATVGEMEAAWNALHGADPKEALQTLLANAVGQKGTPLVEFLGKLGKMGELAVAGEVWRRAVMCADKGLTQQLLAHPDFQRMVREDKSGTVLVACLEVKFEGLMTRFLDQACQLGPPQRALDLCLVRVVEEAPDKSFKDGWDKAFEVLVRHGADPFCMMQKEVAGGFVIEGNSVLFHMAKEASRIYGRAATFLPALLQRHKASEILSHGDQKRSFVGMWNGGQGDRAALVDLLSRSDQEGKPWRDGDPYGAFADALRFGCLNREDPLFVALSAKPAAPLRTPVGSDRIAEIVRHAVRVSMDGHTKQMGDIGDIFAEFFDKDRAQEDKDATYASHRAFWKTCAADLAPLFEEPATWVRACEQIQLALERTAKPSPEEFKACMDAVSLSCGTLPNTASRRASPRL